MRKFFRVNASNIVVQPLETSADTDKCADLLSKGFIEFTDWIQSVNAGETYDPVKGKTTVTTPIFVLPANITTLDGKDPALITAGDLYQALRTRGVL